MSLELDSLIPQLAPGAKWALVSAPVMAFFNVPLLWALLAFVVVDLATGLYKAMLQSKVRSRIFGKALDRLVVYLVAYVVLHTMTLVLPVGSFLSVLPEYLVLTGYLLKESLSILENLKSILSLKGQSSPILDALIARLGVDLDHIVTKVEKADPKEKKPDAGVPAVPTPAKPAAESGK